MASTLELQKEGFELFPLSELESLPPLPGVYAFLNEKGEVLYIGKAVNLKTRVKNHFLNQGFRESLYISQVNQVGVLPTFSEILAFLKEAELIKKYQPRYNVLFKSDVDFFYVVITPEKFPRVLVTHQPQKLKGEVFGPFVEGKALKRTLFHLRKIFPFYTTKHGSQKCSWCHLNMCPGPNPSREKYLVNIEALKRFLKGEGESLLKGLEKEIQERAQNLQLEEALDLKKTWEKLKEVLENSKVLSFGGPDHLSFPWGTVTTQLQDLLEIKKSIEKIEGFDASTLFGEFRVCAQIVIYKGKVQKKEYRLYTMKNPANRGDTQMLKEVLERRLEHPEWQFPEVWFLDGGKAQLNVALEVIKEKRANIIPFSLAKHSNKVYTEKGAYPLQTLPSPLKEFIRFLSWEAHRAALRFHRYKREKIYAL